MTARRESTGGDERFVKLILFGHSAYKADYSLDVVNLCRPFGITAGTMVGANNCVTGIEQSFDDGSQICNSLTVVAEPRAAIDVNNNGIGFLLFLGQIDIAGMVGFVVACIVHIFPFLGGFQFCLHLESAEAACGLCLCC